MGVQQSRRRLLVTATSSSNSSNSNSSAQSNSNSSSNNSSICNISSSAQSNSQPLSHARPCFPPASSEASENLLHSSHSSHLSNPTDRVSHSNVWLLLQLLQQWTQLQFPRRASFGQRGEGGFGQQTGTHCRLLQWPGRRRLWWLLLQLWLSWVRISLCARVEPVLLGGLLLLVLLHLRQLLLLLGPCCSPFQHSHSDSSTA